MPSHVQIPESESENIRLRLISDADYPFLYALQAAPETSAYWRYRGRTPPGEEFSAALWQGALVHYIFEHSPTGVPLGLLSCYDYTGAHGTAYVAVLAQPAAHGSGLAMEAMSLFIDYLFQMFPLRKLYAQSVEFAAQQFMSILQHGFIEEGRLRQHELFQGVYWDHIFFALYRTEWERALRAKSQAPNRESTGPPGGVVVYLTHLLNRDIASTWQVGEPISVLNVDSLEVMLIVTGLEEIGIKLPDTSVWLGWTAATFDQWWAAADAQDAPGVTGLAADD